MATSCLWLRDKYTCQHCITKGVPLQPHHILSYEDFPDKRLDVDNGLTLCAPCHYIEHGWDLSENGIRVLVDDRGITTRRRVGSCLWCGEYLQKQASDMRRADGSFRTYAFCNKKCAMKANGYARKGVAASEKKGFDVISVYEKWVIERRSDN